MMTLSPKQVLGEGPQTCDIVIVGEAAGEDEERLGRPFVGRAGKLLDNLLTDAGITRSSCYITNVVKEHPLDNNISPWFKDGTLTPRGEVAAASLRDEVVLRRPKVVVALGATAKAALTSDRRQITVVRGAPIVTSPLQDEKGQPIVVVPSIHPAAILRGAWMDRYLLKADLTKARRIAAGGGLSAIPNRNLYISPDFTSACQWIEECKELEEVGFDIETSAKEMTCFSLAKSPTEAISIPLRTFNRWDQTKIIERLKSLLEAPTGPAIVTQNGNYDTSFLREFYGIRTFLGRVEDTMCAHHCMLADLGGDEKDTATGVRVKRSSKSLALLASLYTNEPYYKDEGGRARDAGDLAGYLAYNAKDAAITLECWQQLKADLLARPGMMKTYRDLTMARLPAVQEMQAGGIRVNEVEYAALKAKAEAAVGTLMIQLQEEVMDFLTVRRQTAQAELDHWEKILAAAMLVAKENGERKNTATDAARAGRNKAKSNLKAALEPFNPDSSKQCCELFYDFYKRPRRHNRKTKAITVDDEALAEFARPTSLGNAIPAARTIQAIRAERQQIETFLSWELDNDRFRAAFNLRGTKFGRMSSSKLFFRFGGNQQNIPPTVRGVMYSNRPAAMESVGGGVGVDKGGSEEYVPFFVEYDKSQAEWVVVAYEADDAGMIKAVEDGLDVHAWTAHLMSGVPIDEIVYEDKALNKLTSDGEILRVRKELVFPHCTNLAAAKWLPRNMALRQAGKKSNHALNYDEGVNTFAKTNGLSVGDSRHLIHLYHKAYPGVKRNHMALRMKLTAPDTKSGTTHYSRTLTNCFGREMYFMGPLSGKGSDATLRQAYSCIPQSTVADITSCAMVTIVDSMERSAWGRLCSNNHDSLLIEHKVRADCLEHNSGSRKAEVSRIVQEMGRVYQAMNPELHSMTSGKSYRIKTDSKAGLCWGKLEKIEPTEGSVDKFLTKLKNDLDR